MVQQPHILIVDDEPSILRALGRGLRSEEYRVSEASSGQEALRLVREGSLDLVVLDLFMPGMNGFQVYNRIRELSFVPIIVVGDMLDSSGLAISRDLGTEEYVPKPFALDEMVGKIKSVLDYAVGSA